MSLASVLHGLLKKIPEKHQPRQQLGVRLLPISTAIKFFSLRWANDAL